MERYDDLCPRCYRKNNKECRICITQDALRAVRDALLETIDGNTYQNDDGDWIDTGAALKEFRAEFGKGGRFHVED